MIAAYKEENARVEAQHIEDIAQAKIATLEDAAAAVVLAEEAVAAGENERAQEELNECTAALAVLEEQKAAEEAQAVAEAEGAKPTMIRQAVEAAVHEAALVQARAIVVEQMRAIAANSTANGTSNSTVTPLLANVTVPPVVTNTTPPVANATANATANASEPAPGPSDAAVGEMMPVVSMPVPELSPPPEGTPMNISIGNVTIATDPQPVEAFPPVDPRVTDILEPRGSKANTVRVAITVTELLRHHAPRPNNSVV